ncbi:MAG: ComEC/Rec2 family competence protein [Akkermansia sp.]|nr:ComEC/Rec2 family competence protein [Akkermansia sp.]
MDGKRGGIRESVRRWVLASPLFIPLVAVCGALWGGQLWGLSFVACLLAAVCKQWRVCIAAVLCAAVAWLHVLQTDAEQETLLNKIHSVAAPRVCGIVERSLTNGCVVRDDESGAPVLLRGPQAAFKSGEYIVADIELLPSSPAPILGMFDSAAWMRSQGIATGAYCIKAESLGNTFSFAAFRGLADDLRAFFAASLMPAGYEDDARAQVLCALVLGDKTYSDPQTVDVFKYGGCLHIFAVSGLHVGIIAGIVYFVLSRFMLRTRLRTILLLAITALYVFMTGLAVPALRAFLMLALIMLGRELKRPVSMVNIWSAAALLILLTSPWQIHNAGFLLSFVVYAAIGIGIRYGMKPGAWLRPDPFVPPRIYNKKERLIVQADLWLRGVVIMSMSAWLVSLPITMGLFHSFNLYGVFVNIIITPLLLPTMLSGLLCLIPWVGCWFHSFALSCAGVLLSIVGFVADLPNAYLPYQAAQDADALMVYHTGYHDAFCVLGNPGVLINCGNEQTARFCTQPALFHAGFQPSLLVTTQKRASCSGGQGVLQAHYPHLQVLPAWQLKDEVRVFSTTAGTVSVVSASAELKDSPVQNASPIVLWEGETRSVLYVGDASLLTFERIPEYMLKADFVICGYNPALPVTPLHVSGGIPGAQLILLPSAASFTEHELPPDDKVKMWRVNTDSPCLIR